MIEIIGYLTCKECGGTHRVFESSYLPPINAKNMQKQKQKEMCYKEREKAEAEKDGMKSLEYKTIKRLKKMGCPIECQYCIHPLSLDDIFNGS
ncbi:MAG: hypothetical protein H8D67_10805 [Deltaproteobacteria bacterium]|nr:hypothetical protein [Deltaproteobacteria bacterium]